MKLKFVSMANVKSIINQVLRPLGLHILRTPIQRVSGVDLFWDIRNLITLDHPVCMDVGANQGQTIESLLKVFRDPKIYSFEPSLDSFEVLRYKYLYKDNIKLYNLALGSSVGLKDLLQYEDSCLNSFLPLNINRKDNIFYYVSQVGREAATVETVDNWLEQSNLQHIDLLKIDTQGYDLEVLKGAAQSLRKGLITCISIEINFIKMYENQAHYQDIISFLESYNMFLVDFYEKVRIGNCIAWCTALFTVGKPIAAVQSQLHSLDR